MAVENKTTARFQPFEQIAVKVYTPDNDAVKQSTLLTTLAKKFNNLGISVVLFTENRKKNLVKYATESSEPCDAVVVEVIFPEQGLDPSTMEEYTKEVKDAVALNIKPPRRDNQPPVVITLQSISKIKTYM